jgi:hypothetical protein
MTAFRIHFVDGRTVIIDAETPREAASKAAQAGHSGPISKIKRAKDVGTR